MVTGHQTAISRRQEPEPTKWLASHGKLYGRCLDYGCGRKTFRDMAGYDPYWMPERPTGKFDTIICNYVLNVVDAETEKEIIRDILSLLAPYGKAYFAVRRDLPENGKHGRGCFQRNVHLALPLISNTKTRAIYELKS